MKLWLRLGGLLTLGLGAYLLTPVPRARAEIAAFTHVVRSGETLASIAQRYYGDPRREVVLVAENGLGAQGGSAIVVGMRLVIPTVTYHTVQEGESWPDLAERYYGETRRAFLIVRENGGVAGDPPDVGAELLIPYPLRHAAGQNESLRRVAQHYHGSESLERVRTLRRFNLMRGLRPARGQVVLVPLSDLLLSKEGRRVVEVANARRLDGGAVRETQKKIDQEIPVLRDHVRRGRYAESVSLANRLLGASRLTGNQVVSIQRELGIAYVAMGRADLAVRAFRAALSRQADLELDVARTSPKVLRAFERARERHQAAQRRPSAAAAADAGRP